MISPYYMTGHT